MDNLLALTQKVASLLTPVQPIPEPPSTSYVIPIMLLSSFSFIIFPNFVANLVAFGIPSLSIALHGISYSYPPGMYAYWAMMSSYLVLESFVSSCVQIVPGVNNLLGLLKIFLAASLMYQEYRMATILVTYLPISHLSNPAIQKLIEEILRMARLT